MSIITIASSKGGAGKTTLAELISGTICRLGHSVAAIDADYNHSFADWIRTFEYPIPVRSEVDETKIIPLAEELSERHDLLIIDTAGAAMQATIFAIGCADLVLIPCQLSSADVVEAIKTKRLVESAEKMTRQVIPHRAVLTDYQPNTAIARHVEGELATCGLPALQTRLNRLVAFKEMTFNGVVPTSGTAGNQVRNLIDELAGLGALPFLDIKLAS